MRHLALSILVYLRDNVMPTVTKVDRQSTVLSRRPDRYVVPVNIFRIGVIRSSVIPTVVDTIELDHSIRSIVDKIVTSLYIYIYIYIISGHVVIILVKFVTRHHTSRVRIACLSEKDTSITWAWKIYRSFLIKRRQRSRPARRSPAGSWWTSVEAWKYEVGETHRELLCRDGYIIY